VGAEAKDRTIEAIQKIDPTAATPYILKFEKGTGRHDKDGVKIAVGNLWGSKVIALPGPNEEASMGLEVAIRGLREGWEKELIADSIAHTLRERLRSRMAHRL